MNNIFTPGSIIGKAMMDGTIKPPPRGPDEEPEDFVALMSSMNPIVEISDEDYQRIMETNAKNKFYEDQEAYYSQPNLESKLRLAAMDRNDEIFGRDSHEELPYEPQMTFNNPEYVQHVYGNHINNHIDADYDRIMNDPQYQIEKMEQSLYREEQTPNGIIRHEFVYEPNMEARINGEYVPPQKEPQISTVKRSLVGEIFRNRPEDPQYNQYNNQYITQYDNQYNNQYSNQYDQYDNSYYQSGNNLNNTGIRSGIVQGAGYYAQQNGYNQYYNPYLQATQMQEQVKQRKQWEQDQIDTWKMCFKACYTYNGRHADDLDEFLNETCDNLYVDKRAELLKKEKENAPKLRVKVMQGDEVIIDTATNGYYENIYPFIDEDIIQTRLRNSLQNSIVGWNPEWDNYMRRCDAIHQEQHDKYGHMGLIEFFRNCGALLMECEFKELTKDTKVNTRSNRFASNPLFNFSGSNMDNSYFAQTFGNNHEYSDIRPGPTLGSLEVVAPDKFKRKYDKDREAFLAKIRSNAKGALD